LERIIDMKRIPLGKTIFALSMVGSLFSTAFAQAQQQRGPGLIGFLLPFLFIFAVFYFLIILPQSRQEKKRKQMLAALKKGDRVVTSGGLIGQITKVDKEVVSLKISKDVIVRVERDSVKAVLSPAHEGEGNGSKKN